MTVYVCVCVCVCVCVWCAGINVPRSRFLPVKKTSDLLVVMSNLFQLRDGTLVQNPARLYPELPLVKLGEQFFMKARPNTLCTVATILQIVATISLRGAISI